MQTQQAVYGAPAQVIMKDAPREIAKINPNSHELVQLFWAGPQEAGRNRTYPAFRPILNA